MGLAGVPIAGDGNIRRRRQYSSRYGTDGKQTVVSTKAADNADVQAGVVSAGKLRQRASAVIEGLPGGGGLTGGLTV